MKMKYRNLLVLMALAVMVIAYQFHKKAPLTQPHNESKSVVSTMLITNQHWQSTIQSIGNVQASKSILISSEVPGIITSFTAESGQAVTQGQVIINLRADNIKAELEKQKVTLQDDINNYERRKALLPQHYISVADVEHSKAIVDTDRLNVKQQEALLAQRTIVAPFTGVLGISQVQVGQYLSAGQAIVNLESIDPVYVDFSVPEKWVSRIKTGASVTVRSDAYPGNIFKGTIIATSNSINVNSRSLSVRVAVPNPEKKLLSGMAVTVLVSEDSQNTLTIPQSALAYTPDGVGVYVIDHDQKAHWKSVVVGERQTNEVNIVSGLKLGDTIVIAGQQKLQDGDVIAVNNNDLMAAN